MVTKKVKNHCHSVYRKWNWEAADSLFITGGAIFFFVAFMSTLIVVVGGDPIPEFILYMRLLLGGSIFLILSGFLAAFACSELYTRDARCD